MIIPKDLLILVLISRALTRKAIEETRKKRNKNEEKNGCKKRAKNGGSAVRDDDK